MEENTCAREQIITDLRRVLQELGIKDQDIQLEHPAEETHGDYSSNIALVLSPRTKQNPMELAEKIKRKLEVRSEKLEVIEEIEVAPPGFINFWFSKEYLVSSMIRIIEQGEEFGRTDKLAGQKIMVEFADPNPFKEFHIGHLRNISLGESLSRLLEAQGAEVRRVNYQGDVGLHVAKALWGMRKLEKEIPAERVPLSQKVRFLGKAYSAGAAAYEEDEQAKKEIQDLNIKIYRNDPAVSNLWKLGRKWSLDHFEAIYKRVGTVYKRYYFESEVAPRGREIVLSHLQDGIFERHDGAVIFRGEKMGLHTRVFVTKEDYATYEAKDLALAEIKYKDFPYERSFIITAHEQTPYFKVVLAAMRQVFPDLAVKTIHDSFGFVSLKNGKMSSRAGNVITAEWLLDEAKRRIRKQFPEMDEETAEKVAVGAVKYSMLKFSRESDIQFSFEESINLEGNAGPYLQYTYARTQSVLIKVPAKGGSTSGGKTSLARRRLARLETLETEELSVLRAINRFPEIVEKAAKNFAPNLLCNYLFNLAQTFNLFYQKHPIIEGGEKREFRLALTVSIGQILKNGLYLLGIEAPERM